MIRKLSNVIIAFFLLIVTYSNGQNSSQDSFEYSPAGINDYVVTEVEEKSAEEIYSKLTAWIKETYENPEEVVQMEIENDKIRIKGAQPSLLLIKGKKSMLLQYTLEIAVKNNKYKFELSSLTYDDKTDYMHIPNFKTDKKLLKNFGQSAQRIEDFFNGLNMNLKNYVEGNIEDDW